MFCDTDPECPEGFVSRNTCLSRIVMVKYGIWRLGKPAFRDAGLESRNARLSRPVISYAQYQMAPLVITQCSSSFVQLIVRIALDAPYPTPTSHVSVHRSARQTVCLSPGRGGGVGVSRGPCLHSAKYQPCTPRVPWGNQPAK